MSYSNDVSAERGSKLNDLLSDADSAEVTFTRAMALEFFSHPVWVEIRQTLKVRQQALLASLSDPANDRDSDMLNKGALRELSYVLNLEQVLLQEKETEDAE